MKDVVFVTGNTGKVAALKHWLGHELQHKNVDLKELQELDSELVVIEKAKEAYKSLLKPVLIEDVSLEFVSMGRLPGTYIKWFIEELTLEGCCQLLNGFADRSAIVRVTYAYYDGAKMHIFDGEVFGMISAHPKGTNGFGWDSIFIPEGSTMTYAEMDNELLSKFAVRPIAVAKLKAFLNE